MEVSQEEKIPEGQRDETGGGPARLKGASHHAGLKRMGIHRGESPGEWGRWMDGGIQRRGQRSGTGREREMIEWKTEQQKIGRWMRHGREEEEKEEKEGGGGEGGQPGPKPEDRQNCRTDLPDAVWRAFRRNKDPVPESPQLPKL